jgi:predicted unusual protein kinase regulating ubiquinone biosynthesis (AarF/ABC1/UbiB family)
VAVKVQRPDIHERILVDLEALDEVAKVLDAHTEGARRYRIVDVLDEFRRALLRELDYRNEVENLRRMGRDLSDFDRIVVPQPVEDYSGARVLTMDFVRGKKITALSPLSRTELDAAGLADELFRAYLEQILVSGFFHADPHPGNVFLTDDGRVALIDLGQTAQLTPRTREGLLRLLLALGDGRGEETAESALRLAEAEPDHDARGFVKGVADLVARAENLRNEERVVGRQVMELVRIGAVHGYRMPRELVMLGKALLNLDEVGRSLDPDFDPNAAVRRHAASVMQRRMRQSLSPSHLFGSVLEMTELVDRLPAGLNRAIDAISQKGLEVKVRTVDADRFLVGAQGIANRITVGLVIAALIIGAAMLMQIETSFTLFGYPGLAIVLFLGAAIAGLWVVIDVLRRDV